VCVWESGKNIRVEITLANNEEIVLIIKANEEESARDFNCPGTC
jgi:hypothetical protein